MKIAIGNDHIGLDLKNMLDSFFEFKKIEIVHFGSYNEDRMHYPEVAFRVSEAISRGEFQKGILICGTGLGMSIAANKVRGIRAVVCSEPYSAKMAREHNNANILCLGSRVIGSELSKLIINEFLEAKYIGGRHDARVEMINNYCLN